MINIQEEIKKVEEHIITLRSAIVSSDNTSFYKSELSTARERLTILHRHSDDIVRPNRKARRRLGR